MSNEKAKHIMKVRRLRLDLGKIVESTKFGMSKPGFEQLSRDEYVNSDNKHMVAIYNHSDGRTYLVTVADIGSAK